MMIVALAFAAALSGQPAEDLLYSEAHACSVLAIAGRDSHFGDTTPQTTSERALWDALTLVSTRALEEAERAAARQGLDAGARADNEGYARQMLQGATEEQLGQMLDTCADRFEVQAPG